MQFLKLLIYFVFVNNKRFLRLINISQKFYDIIVTIVAVVTSNIFNHAGKFYLMEETNINCTVLY